MNRGGFHVVEADGWSVGGCPGLSTAPVWCLGAAHLGWWAGAVWWVLVWITCAVRDPYSVLWESSSRCFSHAQTTRRRANTRSDSSGKAQTVRTRRRDTSRIRPGWFVTPKRVTPRRVSLRRSLWQILGLPICAGNLPSVDEPQQSPSPPHPPQPTVYTTDTTAAPLHVDVDGPPGRET